MMYPLRQASRSAPASSSAGQPGTSRAALRMPRTPRLLIGGRSIAAAASPIAARTSSVVGSRCPLKSNVQDRLRGGNGWNAEPRAAAKSASVTGCSSRSRSHTSTLALRAS
jgi:hypothetical protein